MQATALSNIISKTNARASNLFVSLNVKQPCPPRRVSKRWPATILAASRTANVKGRITALTVSIITITGIKATGVPKGTK